MPTQLQLRRGTTTEHSTFSGAVGEVTVDTTKDTLVVHDGATNGGFPLAKEAGATFGNTNVTGDFSFADNAKAIFGAGSDLQIYHDASDSYIVDGGTGNLRIQGEDIYLMNSAGTEVKIRADDDSFVKLYFDNAEKLATTSTGVDVTGTVTADGLTVDGDLAVSAANSRIRLFETDTTDLNTQLQNQAGDFNIQTLNDAASSSTNRIKIDHATGDISFYASNGTTQGLFWDASAESLGIGTSSPSHTLDVQGDVDTWVSRIYNTGSDANAQGLLVRSDATSAHNATALGVYANSGYKMVVKSTGNVGIGTSSPNQKLEVNGTDARIYLTGSNTDIDMDNSGNGQLHLDGNSYAFGIALNTDGAQLYTNSVSRDLIFGVNETEVMRVTDDSVGIGTNSTEGSYKLDVRGWGTFRHPTGDCNLKIQVGNTTGFSVLQFGDTADTDAGYVAYNHASNYMSFRTNGTGEDMRIDSSGNVGIGTSSPSTSTTYMAFRKSNFDRTQLVMGHSDTGNRTLVNFFGNGSQAGAINVSPTATTYGTSSDYRLKENVDYDWDATTRLKQLRPARFNFIADADTTVDGFLAHEVQDIVPEAITGTKDAMMDEKYEVSAATGDIYTPAAEATFDEDGNEVTAATDEVIHSTDVEQPETLAEGQQWRETTPAVMGTRSVPDYQGIDQSKLVPLLVKTIQELEARITALEAN